MKKYINKKKEKAVSSTTNKTLQKKNKETSSFQFLDNRTKTENTPSNNSLPENLKDGIEKLSGHSMDDVKVHYNSNKPAQLQADAYAQGSDIHVASGKEKHLPHEAWHVVQQKEGRVKPTTQLKGHININNDSVLEREADLMGAKALHGSTKDSKNVTQRKTIESNTIQMAGHDGVMIFSKNKKKLCKRIEANEARQFQLVMYDQCFELDDDKRRDANMAFPKIHQVILPSSKAPELNEFGEEQDWKNKHSQGDYYVVMESLGGKDIDIFDFKIGTTTANKDELKFNYDKTEKETQKKVNKMSKVDENSETSQYGLRDSDELRNVGDAVKRWFGNYRATLGKIEQRVTKLPNKKYPDNSQVFENLDAIARVIRSSDTVYIASSLILKANTDLNKIDEDRIALIDLAHPMQNYMNGFDDVKEGMLLGIYNLRRVLEGKKKMPLKDFHLL